MPAPGAPGFERRRDRLPRNVSGTEVRPDRATASTSTVTVRDATFDVLRRRGMTRIFSNPGSTEVPFLVDLPVGSRVRARPARGLRRSGSRPGGRSAGESPPSCCCTRRPGLGNAVSALATARVNRAPLVVAVGQQDRRHLAHEPFLAGKLAGLAGEYPVWVDQPIRPQDVPGSPRARHGTRRETRRGPALVIVPMDDWQAPAPEPYEHAAPDRLVRAAAADAAAVEELAQLLEQAESPALVAGAGADDPETWSRSPRSPSASALRSGRSRSARGRASRRSTRSTRAISPPTAPGSAEALSGHDVVLVVGGPAFRQYAYAEGPFVEEGTVVARRHRGSRRGAPQPGAARRAGATSVRLCRARRAPPAARQRAAALRPAPEPPAPGSALRAGHVLSELAARLPRDAIVLEEAPSNRPELLARLPATENLGLISPAMGGLGFAMPARDRPAPGASLASRGRGHRRRLVPLRRSSRSGVRATSQSARCS